MTLGTLGNPGTRERLLAAIRTEAQRCSVVLPEGIESANGQMVELAKQAGLDETALLRATSESLGVAFEADLQPFAVSAEFVKRVPIGFARQHGIVGLAGESAQRMRLVMADPLDSGTWQQLDVVERYLGMTADPLVSTRDQVALAINRGYQQQSGQTEAFIQQMSRAEVLDEVRQMDSREDLLNLSGRAPVIKLVNLILFEAVQQQASDVHVQPYEDRVVVRMRIDGVLFDSFELPKAVQEEVVSRVKVMGRMNIAEKRLPQDGRATVQVGDRLIDLRLSTVPASFGERLVIRLLDKSARLYTPEELGMDPRMLGRFRQLIGVEHGLVLVTGPTGSGKSTTLYAALQEINAKELNVITLEDPIEYQLPGVSQIQISDRKGMTFASGLRSVLRQDPDIIMVGEIRDHETAVMAIQSALTGHLVFSTLHTNDAASAITRLLDLGIEPYLVSSSLVGVLAQRLVRRVCGKCSEPAAATPEERAALDLAPNLHLDGLRRGRGCPECRKTGYRGRVGVFELLLVTDAVRHLVQQRQTAAEIKAAGLSEGMKTLRDDGLEKASRGVTTLDEVARVTMRATI